MFSRTPINRIVATITGFATLALVIPSLALALRPSDDTGYVGTLVLAPAIAQVSPGSLNRPDNRSGPLGANAVAVSVKFSNSDDVFMRAASHHSYKVQAVRPDDRAGILGVGPITAKFHTIKALQRLHRHVEFAR